MLDFLLFILLIIFLLFVYFLLKNNHTCKMHKKIIEAIYNYNIHQINLGYMDDSINYDAKESYEKTLFRIFDWGYKNIVPKDIFEKIKPFVEDKNLIRGIR